MIINLKDQCKKISLGKNIIKRILFVRLDFFNFFNKDWE